MINEKDVLKRVYEMVIGYPPVNSKVLYAQLAVDFIGLKREEIHALVADLVDRNVITELKYQCINDEGSLFFPPETSFVINNRSLKAR